MTHLEIAVAKHEQQLEHSACRLKRIEEKLDRLHTWLIGVLGGVRKAGLFAEVRYLSRGWRVDGAPMQARSRAKAHVGRHRRDKSMPERNQR